MHLSVADDREPAAGRAIAIACRQQRRHPRSRRRDVPKLLKKGRFVRPSSGLLVLSRLGARRRPSLFGGWDEAMTKRARWSKVWLERAEGVLLLEFWDSPDVVPVEAVVDEQTDYIGIVLLVAGRPGSEWTRQSLERHVAEVASPMAVGARPLRDVKPRREQLSRVVDCAL